MDLKLNGNLWKLVVNQLTQKRYYIPILSIFFLTLPDATAKQIGLWSGIGFLSEFLFEIPSGSLSYASQSGTRSAFLHETLVGLKREKEFVKISSKITAKVALISILFVITIPYFAKIDIHLPLLFSLIIDLVGLAIVVSLSNPKFHEKIKENKSILKLIKETRGNGFFSLAIFTSAITGFIIASNRYVYPYLGVLGFPIAYLGLIMGLSALVQYVVANNLDKFENKINLKKIFLFDLVIFSLS